MANIQYSFPTALPKCSHAAPAQLHGNPDRHYRELDTYPPVLVHLRQQQQPQNPPQYQYLLRQYQQQRPPCGSRDPPIQRDTTEDGCRPKSTGHVPEGTSSTHLPAPSLLTPAVPGAYPDNTPQHMNYEDAPSMPPTPDVYSAPTSVTRQTSREQLQDCSLNTFEPLSGGHPSARKKRKRVSQACNRCRQLKVRCDGVVPCERCKRMRANCIYSEHRPKLMDQAQADIVQGPSSAQTSLDSIISQLEPANQRLNKTESHVPKDIATSAAKAGSPVGGECTRPPTSPYFDKGASAVRCYNDAHRDHPSSEPMPLRMMAEEEMEVEPGPPVPPGEPAIPINHTTLAGLLLEWPSIRELTKHHVEREGVRYISEYPISQEQNRGVLILYGRGEDSHPSQHVREPTDHGNLDVADDLSDMASPSPAADWGQLGGLSPPDQVEYKGGVLPLPHGSPALRNGAIPPPPNQGSLLVYSSHSHSSGLPSPKEQDRNIHSRRSSIHGTDAFRSGYSLKKNYEVIPGLEYFAYATDILGNHAGAYNNMKNVYANIFAGLYHGQLGRPMESFAFIHRASHKLQVIMRPSLDKMRRIKRNSEFIQETKYNQLALTFWTCLQLESDLIAEMQLPPSGLLSYEDDMPHPNMSLLEGFNQRILDSYPGQLYLRTHLNSIHRMFYAPEDPAKPGKDKFRNVGVVSDAVSGMHWVAPSFAFREDDPPADDILAARLRAKYWGAQVITYRPFIRQILQFSHSIKNHASSPNFPSVSSEFRQDITAPVIHPKARTHGDVDPQVVELAKKGIKALIESTRAFHGLGDRRPIITNIFGTAHAQWGNLLILSAAFRDPILHTYVDEELLRTLFHKTIQFLRQSATATSALRTDMHILEGLQRDLFQLRSEDQLELLERHKRTWLPYSKTCSHARAASDTPSDGRSRAPTIYAPSLADEYFLS
ncbi:hypothetical protein FOXG_12561 [Fusarium oxysporum f. sp. lycopersici 4287]|uniref:Zn(2)-C6 fungal-type domain-containing protein n=1 Tax=Fusarium oxysporum f. sp. lycopersici (strain 4287 / CBS 123668 / FGSC 9935 / NRRL 34936) TaxID=426428 RepID=A0A0J9VTK3_FUSO4|nr:hypothetical protein FOXG_12561 [Fusarium oxysporum f. sp. lycopersici 4287]KNB13975.1 hypothetical protein FOXG_12561 [Fusarium oxysporum f. sp. lycopersici 4287]